MAVFKVEKTRDHTVMANHHLRNKNADSSGYQDVPFSQVRTYFGSTEIV